VSAPPILLVEDSPDDRLAVVRALRRAGIREAIVECADGEEALEFLHRRGRHLGAPRPSVVLLDLNMPRVDGVQVLVDVKGCEGLREIPVIVLTTSSDERDIARSYGAGANSYVQKPVGSDRLTEAIDRLVRFWFNTAVLPSAEPTP